MRKTLYVGIFRDPKQSFVFDSLELTYAECMAAAKEEFRGRAAKQRRILVDILHRPEGFYLSSRWQILGEAEREE